MADIFQAYDRDQDKGDLTVQYEVMSRVNGFWYHDQFCATLEEAQAEAAGRLGEPNVTGVLIDRVTRQMVERLMSERVSEQQKEQS